MATVLVVGQAILTTNSRLAPARPDGRTDVAATVSWPRASVAASLSGRQRCSHGFADDLGKLFLCHIQKDPFSLAVNVSGYVPCTDTFQRYPAHPKIVKQLLHHVKSYSQLLLCFLRREYVVLSRCFSVGRGIGFLIFLNNSTIFFTSYFCMRWL